MWSSLSLSHQWVTSSILSAVESWGEILPCQHEELLQHVEAMLLGGFICYREHIFFKQLAYWRCSLTAKSSFSDNGNYIGSLRNSCTPETQKLSDLAVSVPQNCVWWMLVLKSNLCAKTRDLSTCPCTTSTFTQAFSVLEELTIKMPLKKTRRKNMKNTWYAEKWKALHEAQHMQRSQLAHTQKIKMQFSNKPGDLRGSLHTWRI